MDLLRKLHAEGATICMVTHDTRYADFAERRVQLFDGRILFEDRVRPVVTPAARAGRLKESRSCSLIDDFLQRLARPAQCARVSRCSPPSVLALGLGATIFTYGVHQHDDAEAAAVSGCGAAVRGVRPRSRRAI